MFELETENGFQNLLKELTEVAGPSGYEGPVREVMRKHISPWADHVTTDKLGSLIAQRGSSGPKVMIAGHLDEVGFLVTKITKEGFIKFQPLGGWWSQVLPAQRVRIVTRKEEFIGIIGSKPPHLMKIDERKKGVTLEDLFIDVGAESQEEVQQMGISPGDPIVPDSDFITMSNANRWMGKAMDNRLGCAVVVEVFKRLAQRKGLANQLFGVGTVMEEVGLRGARTSTATIQPDVAFAIDVGISGDTPGIGELPADVRLGKGPALTLYDAGHIAHGALADLAKDVAEREEIPIQFEFIRGGATDASAIHMYNQGVPTISLCIPARYIHSHATIVDQRDVMHLVDWLVAMIERLDQQMIDSLHRG
ncbi:endoglucanase [Seinonella peptonophila]|uniref:Endoglucanase n=1 Tax=Seinonella peptonophila TaxID=112248 RepID=A0A1M4U6C6_9BACL|nr:M42 family metallopeptidase [Seinonella peptonophila]SHE52193.1 endoglucanase [Seinonella peptonophila]